MDFKSLFKKYKMWIIGGVFITLVIIENVLMTGGM